MRTVVGAAKADRDVNALPVSALIAAWPDVLGELVSLGSRIDRVENATAMMQAQLQAITGALADVTGHLQAASARLAAFQEKAASAQRRAEAAERQADELRQCADWARARFLSKYRPNGGSVSAPEQWPCGGWPRDVRSGWPEFWQGEDDLADVFAILGICPDLQLPVAFGQVNRNQPRFFITGDGSGCPRRQHAAVDLVHAAGTLASPHFQVDLLRVAVRGVRPRRDCEARAGRLAGIE
jgi:hypothetical protein